MSPAIFQKKTTQITIHLAKIGGNYEFLEPSQNFISGIDSIQVGATKESAKSARKFYHFIKYQKKFACGALFQRKTTQITIHLAWQQSNFWCNP